MKWRTVLIIFAATALVAVVAGSMTWLVNASSNELPVTVHYVLTGSGPISGPPSQPGSDKQDQYFARRADGSTVQSRVVTGPDGKQYTQRTVADAAKGVRVVIDGVTQSITTYHLSKVAVAELRAPARRCGNDASPSGESLMGHAVVRTVLNANGRIETFLAPDLGCVLLRERVYRPDANGNDRQVASKEAVAVMPGDPDPALFVIPDWPERSPSEVTSEMSKKFHLQPPLGPDLAADQAYRQIPRH
jgi:hypothetical protein